MFNFGAFAGGLATAIQTQQKLNLEEDKYNADIKTAEAKLKLEGDKLKKQQEEDIAKAEKDRADGAVKVEEVMGKTDIGLEARINQANNMSKIYKLGTAKTMISDPTSGEKFVVDIPQEHLPTVEGIQKDLDIYKNEGNFKLDNTGALYTRPNAESEFTPIGFKGTNAKAFTKEEKPKSSFGVINGKEGFYTEEQLANATAQGMSVERSKDKPANTNITVEAQKQQTTDSAFQYIEDIKSDPTKFNKATANKLEAQVMSTDYGKSDAVKQLRGDALAAERSVKSLERLKTDIQSKVDSKQFENQYTNFAKTIGTKFAPDNWDIMSAEDKQKSYELLRTQGAMGDALAQYLKSNSGTAASEKEALRNITNIFGSGSQFANIKSVNESLDGFITNKKSSLMDIGSQALDNGLPATGGRIVSEYGMKPTPKIESPKTEVVKAPYGNEVERNGKNYIWDTSRNKYILKP